MATETGGQDTGQAGFTKKKNEVEGKLEKHESQEEELNIAVKLHVTHLEACCSWKTGAGKCLLERRWT